MTKASAGEVPSEGLADNAPVFARAAAVCRRVWAWLQRTRPYRAFSHFTDVGGSVLSAGMSYQALFAVFAALWLGFSVFGVMLAGRPELLETLINQINASVPGLIGEGDDTALVNVKSLLEEVNFFNPATLIASLALLWVALNWFTGTRRSIRIIFGLDVKQYRSAVLLKLRDLVLALIFGLALLVSAALTVLSSTLMDAIFGWFEWNRDTWLFGTVGTLARYAALYIFDVLVLMAMHRYLAEVRLPRLRLLIGCALGGAALLGLKVLGASLLRGSTSNPLLDWDESVGEAPEGMPEAPATPEAATPEETSERERVGDDDGKQIAQGRQAGGLQRCRRDDVALRIGQVAGGGRAGHDGGREAEVEGAAGGRIDAHVGHEADENNVLAPGGLQLRLEVGADEGVGIVLDDHRLVGGRGDLVGDGADRGTHVVRGTRAGVVLDVDDRDTEPAGAGEHGGGFVEGGLDPAEGHDALPVGVLAVDQDQHGLGQRGRRGGQTAEVAQGDGVGHDAASCGLGKDAQHRRGAASAIWIFLQCSPAILQARPTGTTCATPS